MRLFLNRIISRAFLEKTGEILEGNHLKQGVHHGKIVQRGMTMTYTQITLDTKVHVAHGLQ
jgi:hypothetical protein